LLQWPAVVATNLLWLPQKDTRSCRQLNMRSKIFKDSFSSEPFAASRNATVPAGAATAPQLLQATCSCPASAAAQHYAYSHSAMPPYGPASQPPTCPTPARPPARLQSMVFGSDRGRFTEPKRAVSDKNLGPLVGAGFSERHGSSRAGA